MIVYMNSVEDVSAEQLRGFFQGWPNPPSRVTHLELLRGSDHVILAVDDEADRVVGFITAVSDGVLSAYIPFLEVVPEYRGRGIGSELIRRMLGQLQDLYMTDLLCDLDLRPLYARLGMHPAVGMTVRKHDRQSGA